MPLRWSPNIGGVPAGRVGSSTTTGDTSGIADDAIASRASNRHGAPPIAPPASVPLRSSLRTRALCWTLIVLAPLAAASAATIRLIDDELTERVINDLADIRRLEIARIDQALDAYEREAVGLAGGVHVRSSTAQVVGAGNDAGMDPMDGAGDVDPIDPTAPTPLDEVAVTALSKTATAGGAASDATIVAPDGTPLGSTPGARWRPADPTLIAAATRSGTGAFGEAFRTEAGDRVGYVQPIVEDGAVVGALLLEFDLDRITDFVVAHEGIGDTSEAHLAQPTPTGDAEFITLLRFDRDAAFSRVVPATAGKPINWALDEPGRTVQARDYRDVESFLSIETVPRTGWGLVVKIDRAEALSGAGRIRNVILGAGAAVALAVAAMWLGFLRPLTRRIRGVAEAAAAMTGDGGDVPSDEDPDEVGELARTIRRLSTALVDDERMRGDYEAELYRRATRDELTGLVNRQHATAVVEELATALDDVPSSLLFADLDGFKVVNDSYGHLVGDEVLRDVAGRLTGAVPQGASVARWGGDEFVVVLPGYDETAARAVADDVRDALVDPVRTTVGELPLRCSLGVSTSRPGWTLDELLRDADQQMFAEKSARNGRRDVDTAMLRELEQALTDDRIEVYFQPIAEVPVDGTPRLVAVEALVRLRTLDGSILPPATFLAAAQGNHLGRALDWRVAELATATFGAWLADGIVDDRVRLAVNLCEASTLWAELPAALGDLLGRAGVPPGRLAVEISEDTAHVESAVIDRLRSLGVSIVIDSLGAGRSGVSRLAALRPFAAKIDCRWLDWTRRDVVAPADVIARMVDMCALFGVRVAVAGVETQVQLDVVRSTGVGVVQGFLLDRPLTRARFAERWLRPPASPDRAPAPAVPRSAGEVAAG